MAGDSTREEDLRRRRGGSAVSDRDERLEARISGSRIKMEMLVGRHECTPLVHRTMDAEISRSARRTSKKRCMTIFRTGSTD